MSDIFEGLNSVQQEAVKNTEGPLLVLAGAGTGKTKVLTSRIVNILNQRLAKMQEILAVTFTNKASKEMKERIEGMLGYPIDGFWIGTFHSIGLRIIKRHVAEVGLKNNFTIVDTDDCEKIIKQILVDKNIDGKKFPPSLFLNLISRLKDKNIMFDNIPEQENTKFDNCSLQDIYESYQNRLRSLNSVDFGDLLLLCVDLFRQFPDVLAKWQNQFKYILVDEYQDTNTLQYIFIRILGLKYGNVCAVGDDDQSIYSWRGAEIANILKFSEDFSNAKVLRLEQNYRSTNPILKVASQLIAKNDNRFGKTLWTENTLEHKVKLYEAFNSKQEAEFISNTIEDCVRKNYQYKNIAVLVRSTFQMREIEERFIYNAIPYKVVGGNKFYDRMEIKDAIAYLRIVNQSYDDLAFLRIINTPKRGIGDSSIDKIRQYANNNMISMFESAKRIIGQKVVSAKVENELNIFVELIDHGKQLLTEKGLGSVAEYLLKESGYVAMWELEKSQEAKSRVENIKELYTALDSYENLETFLENVTLSTSKDDEHEDNKASIMTMHGSKGLEFDVVFLSGWEEGIMPNQRSIEETGDLALQEERRLAYVGITRAKKELYISYANNRLMYGNWQSCMPSRFLMEIPAELLDKVKDTGGYINQGYQNNFTRDSFTAKKPAPRTVDDSDFVMPKNTGIKVGQRVVHNTMGEGEVQQLQGIVATVKFDTSGTKKIMISFLKGV